MTENEFRQWYKDYAERWPAIARYNGGWPSTARMQTYYWAVRQFKSEVLFEVTERIMAGELEPVANEKLGMFGTEIRNRILRIRDEEIREEERVRYRRGERPPHWDGLSLQWMMCIMNATHDLMCELANEDLDYRDTEKERHAAYDRAQGDLGKIKVLQEAGLEWEVIEDRAHEMASGNTKPLLKSVDF
jgi:hypothetical protein